MVDQPSFQNTLMLAVHQYREGRLDAAEQTSRKALKVAPRNSEVLRLLGLISSKKGHHIQATKLLRRAVKFNSKCALAHTDLGKVLVAQGTIRPGIDAFKQAISLEPNLADAHLNLAHALRACRKDNAAIRSYRHAIQLAPDLYDAYLFLGHTLIAQGQSNRAVEAYTQAVSLKPDEGAVYWALANSSVYSFTEDQVQHMLALVDAGSIGRQSELSLYFALARAYENLKQYAVAFDFLERGNRIQRSMLQYDIDAEERLADEITKTFTPELFGSKPDVGHPSEAPIFLISLPRSGSTLVEQILASHPQITGGDEMNVAGSMIADLNKGSNTPAYFLSRLSGFGAKKLTRLGQDYLNQTREYAANTPHFTDKSLNNFSLVGFLHLILPNARFINCRRDPADTCLSCYKQLFVIGQHFSYDLKELGRFYRVYDQLMHHWHRLLPDQILDVHYEDLVTNQEVVTRRILDFLELPWEDTCLSFHQTERTIRTVSSGQVRQPVYTTAVKRWQHYQQHLGPLLEELRREPTLID